MDSIEERVLLQRGLKYSGYGRLSYILEFLILTQGPFPDILVDKILKIGGFEKLTFFEATKFQYSEFSKLKFFFSLIPAEMFHKFLGSMNRIQFL